jgi:hypothetical protein
MKDRAKNMEKSSKKQNQAIIIGKLTLVMLNSTDYLFNRSRDSRIFRCYVPRTEARSAGSRRGTQN